MIKTKTQTDELQRTLESPLFEAIDQVGNLLTVKKSSLKSSQITPELHQYEKDIIAKRGSTPYRK